MNMQSKFSHTDEHGKARMVDVTGKPSQIRKASATGLIHLNSETIKLISENKVQKGDVLTVAEIAGIQAAKKTSELIPLCHPLRLTNVQVDLELDDDLPGVQITATVRTIGKTGVEMEALAAVSVAALTIYDMAKAVEKTMLIRNIRLVEKRGGQSGEVKNE